MTTACFIFVTFTSGYTGFIDKNRVVSVSGGEYGTRVCISGEDSCYHIKEKPEYFITEGLCHK